MYLHGQFYTRTGRTVGVSILTGGDRTEDIEIGSEGSGIDFTGDPLETESGMSDTFDVLLQQSCTIRLLTTRYLGQLFSSSALDSPVVVTIDGTPFFCGYVEPQTYSQDYNDSWDAIEINCIDALSVLQYSRWADIGRSSVSYTAAKANAGTVTFLGAVSSLISYAMSGLSGLSGGTTHIWYDCSKLTAQDADGGSLFAQLSLPELLFLGDTVDDAWKRSEVLEALLRFLNLHITQQGCDFYIFDWATVRSTDAIQWADLLTSGIMTTTRTVWNITAGIVDDDQAQISVLPVYNRLKLTCEVKSQEDLIESPLDTDLLSSPYANKQLYLTEYAVPGTGSKELGVFLTLIREGSVDWDSAVVRQWYMQVMSNSRWTFGSAGTDWLDTDAVRSGLQQNLLPDRLRQEIGGALIRWGSVDTAADKSDNSPVSTVDMTTYLALSVNGNGDDTETGSAPTEDTVKAAIPMATYTGAVSGGVLSPADGDTHNYIVFSGSILLCPRTSVSAAYADIAASDWAADVVTLSGKCPPVSGRDYGRFYTRRWYAAGRPNAEPQDYSPQPEGLVPPADDCPQSYEFRYSAVGDSSDTVSKVGVLACMLVVGSKCLVEKLPGEDLGTGTAGTGQGQVSDFVWQTFKERSECSGDDEYYSQCFTIGIDPKIGDKIIGTEFSIQNNISYTLGIEAEGTAVSISRDDALTGKVRFMILGPVNNIVWNDITRRHRTWFRRETWHENTIPLLSHISTIYIKNFEVKIYSDNGLTDNGQDNDLIYMSDTDDSCVNVKDDIKFTVHSALSTSEAASLGIRQGINLSVPALADGTPVVTIYDRLLAAEADRQSKAERQYLDSYYREWRQGRIELRQALQDTGRTVSLWDHYRHPALDRDFFVEALDRNVREDSVTLKLKETTE